MMDNSNIMSHEDAQIVEAKEEIERFSKQIGNLESLDKEKFPFVDNLISGLKQMIKFRQDAIRKYEQYG